MVIENWQDELGGKYLATFDVYFEMPNGQRMKNYKVVRAKSGKIFVSHPSYSIEINGERKWIPYLSYNAENQKKFNEKLEELIKPFLTQNQLMMQAQEPDF